MLFHSTGFLFAFLPLFMAAVMLSPRGPFRSVTLLIASYLFYSGAEPFFVCILMLSSITDFSAALFIHGSKRNWLRRLGLLASVCINLGILGFYKYGNWITGGAMPYLSAVGLGFAYPQVFNNYLLPAGISFYTFQSMSYTIDVYRRQITPDRNLLDFCNFVAYLPQLIAGPIERFDRLAPQIKSFNNGRAVPAWSAGLDRIALGVVQKLFIADGCGRIVDRLAAAGGGPDFFSAWGLALGFGMQIYFDFAAYSHMAIGLSLLLGIRLQENFHSPYKALDMQDFWRRWHVSLSRWFRDYVYIPLGGSRKGTLRTLINVMITFFLVGLWHGAGMNFLIWGVGHGLSLAAFRLKQIVLPDWRPSRQAAWLATFTTVHFLWVPFRLDESARVLSVWKGMLALNGFVPMVVSIPDMVFLLLVVAGTVLAPNAAERWPGYSGWKESLAITALALFGLMNTPEVNQFIYFQF
jgi:alginate O-acetyltransferase complex protein AlgI